MPNRKQTSKGSANLGVSANLEERINALQRAQMTHREGRRPPAGGRRLVLPLETTPGSHRITDFTAHKDWPETSSWARWSQADLFIENSSDQETQPSISHKHANGKTINKTTVEPDANFFSNRLGSFFDAISKLSPPRGASKEDADEIDKIVTMATTASTFEDPVTSEENAEFHRIRQVAKRGGLPLHIIDDILEPGKRESRKQQPVDPPEIMQTVSSTSSSAVSSFMKRLWEETQPNIDSEADSMEWTENEAQRTHRLSHRASSRENSLHSQESPLANAYYSHTGGRLGISERIDVFHSEGASSTTRNEERHIDSMVRNAQQIRQFRDHLIDDEPLLISPFGGATMLKNQSTADQRASNLEVHAPERAFPENDKPSMASQQRRREPKARMLQSEEYPPSSTGIFDSLLLQKALNRAHHINDGMTQKSPFSFRSPGETETTLQSPRGRFVGSPPRSQLIQHASAARNNDASSDNKIGNDLQAVRSGSARSQYSNESLLDDDVSESSTVKSSRYIEDHQFNAKDDLSLEKALRAMRTHSKDGLEASETSHERSSKYIDDSELSRGEEFLSDRAIRSARTQSRDGYDSDQSDQARHDGARRVLGSARPDINDPSLPITQNKEKNAARKGPMSSPSRAYWNSLSSMRVRGSFDSVSVIDDSDGAGLLASNFDGCQLDNPFTQSVVDARGQGCQGATKSPSRGVDNLTPRQRNNKNRKDQNIMRPRPPQDELPKEVADKLLYVMGPLLSGDTEEEITIDTEEATEKSQTKGDRDGGPRWCSLICGDFDFSVRGMPCQG